MTAWAVAAAVTGGAVAAWHAANGEAAPSLELLAVLWVVTVLANLISVSLDLGGNIRESLSLTEIAAVLLIVLLPPHWALAIAVTAVPIAQAVLTRGVLLKMVFNVGWNVTAIALGSMVYYAISGPGFTPRLADLLAAVLAGGVFVVTNAVAFTGLLARLRGSRWAPLAREEVLPRIPLDFGMAMTGLLTAVLAVSAPLALPLLALPIVMDYLRTQSRRAGVALEVAKRQAEAANRAKSEFVSQMSHELRTPLNAILGFGQLLELSQLDPDDQEAVAQILLAGHHLLALIDDVLDLSRIEAGRMDLTVEPVQLAELLSAAVALIQPMAEARSIEVTVDLAGCDTSVAADRRRAHQALLNLLSNAVKYNRDGGDVTVRCEQRGDDLVRICVSDTGPGIPPDRQAHLFEPFERLGAEDSGIQGTGLGLSLTKRLVEGMGGEIGFATTPGKGSTFWLELPSRSAGD